MNINQKPNNLIIFMYIYIYIVYIYIYIERVRESEREREREQYRNIWKYIETMGICKKYKIQKYIKILKTLKHIEICGKYKKYENILKYMKKYWKLSRNHENIQNIWKYIAAY